MTQDAQTATSSNSPDGAPLPVDPHAPAPRTWRPVRALGEKISEWFKERVWRLALWAMPRVLQERNRQIVQAATESAVHRILDREGISHCIKCPNRFGLAYLNPQAARKDRVLVCQKHLAELKGQMKKASPKGAIHV